MCPSRFKQILIVVLTVTIALLDVQQVAAQSTSAVADDIYGSQFETLIDSLEKSGDNEQLYKVLLPAAHKAEADNSVRQAVRFYTKALTAAERMSSNTRQIDCLIALSAINYKREYFGTGIKQLARAQQTAEENNMTEELLKVTDAQWRLFEKLDDMPNAFKYYKRYSELQSTSQASQITSLKQQLKTGGTPNIDSNSKVSHQRKAERQSAGTDSRTLNLLRGVAVGELVFIVLMIAFIVFIRRNAAARIDAVNRSIKAIPATVAAQAYALHHDAAKLAELKKPTVEALQTSANSLAAQCQQLALMIANQNTLVGAEQTETVKTDLDTLVKESVGRMKNFAQEQHQELQYISTGRNVVNCQPQVISQTIDNMITSALKYSRQGSVIKLWIETDSNRTSIGIESGEADNTDRPDDQTSATIIVEACHKAADDTGCRVSIKTDEEGKSVASIEF